MRILLSAYACEPNEGSEPGIGWQWAIELQRAGHEVVVLTRANNRARIEDYFASTPGAAQPAFVYFDLAPWLVTLKSKGLLPLQLYYLFWQIFCVKVARQAAHHHRPELVWHITFGVIRVPSFLWRLGLPFVFGPAGGGERAPLRMRQDYTLAGHLRDGLRDVLNLISSLDPLMWLTFARSDLILTKTRQSARFVPWRWRNKTKVFLELGVRALGEEGPAGSGGSIRFLYAGGFIYLKAITLAIRAFAAFVRLGGVGRFTLVGRGPERSRAEALAKQLGVDALIDWVSWVDQRELARIYATHDVFVFPSLHDSSGNVVIEALSHGLPVVCFDLGGPAEIVTSDCGVIQSTAGLSAHAAAATLGRTLKALQDDASGRERLSSGARQRAEEFLWPRRVEAAIDLISGALSVGRAGVP
ncbi:MAG: glycosyltransferase [Alphaproteobacteria bacterium]|nr:glycosyltransferase [Alphaproteobacteria bacterium]